MTGTTYEERKQQYIDRWLQAAPSVETDAELGKAVLELILGLVRIQHGIAENDPRCAAIDAATIRRLGNPDDLAPMHSIAEAVFRKLATNPEKAMRYLADHISARSSDQSKRARKPRPSSRDSITRLIGELLEDDPTLSSKRVGQLLADMKGEITFLDGVFRHNITAATLEEGNLPSRVSDAKKRLKANSG
ncbi:MAG: hypothetical protein O9247_01180 [Rhodobacteraceae bacterium]|nr:hypothetical protein [Paracoccaceae bacterium]